ncbi:class I SAM-dependent DNA methyltransferase [Amycolatopsis australiensis]|uniref:Methyltransferase domain-containing protein n=1 Tax=Amycolatopsis australiensis TaxID=546364 RepID=A0A1K1PNX5_9PSEU|nr:class I SAM-dependent methyltransferase [Amycolatopsis australiensis]SFW49133.1 Methyltransferase domain-containing protein [Amycolatopsis australiensis]
MTTAYDAVAAQYAEFVRDIWDDDPLDRAAWAAFADYVRGRGPVADLGCGPGHLTAHLRDLGVDAFGVDVSPAMIELARAAEPGLRFEVGSMAALDLPGASLAGILSWYSVIHTPPGQLPAYFAEFTRTLASGGHVLLGFFESGDAVSEFDHKVTTAYRWPLDTLAELASAAGLVEVGRVSREPVAGERPFRQGRLLLRKP